MVLTDLETLLGITVAEADKPTYEARLLAALSHINKQCGGRFADPVTGDVTLPFDVQMGAALLVEEMGNSKDAGVGSRSLGDMSISSVEGGAYRAAAKFWKSYKIVRFF